MRFYKEFRKIPENGECRLIAEPINQSVMVVHGGLVLLEGEDYYVIERTITCLSFIGNEISIVYACKEGAFQ
jgi:hypothetical protein